MKILKWLANNSKWVLNEKAGGGGTKIESAPVTPAPNPADTAEAQYQARLKYDPLVAQQTMGIQQQYMPQQTALEAALAQQYTPQLSQMLTDIQKQQMPQLQALQAQLFPQQTQVLEAGAGQALAGLQAPQAQQLQQAGLSQALAQLQQPQSALMQQLGIQAQQGLAPSGLAQTAEQQALQGLQQNPLMQNLGVQAQQGLAPNALAGTVEQQALSGMQQTPLQQALSQQAMAGLTPTGLSPQQQAAIDAIRGRQMTEMERGIRGSAQMGGGLFGGRREQREDISRQQMGQQFAAEDVNRLLAQQQQAFQQAQTVYGTQEQARQQQLAQLSGAAALTPGLQQQAIQSGLGVAGQQAQTQQQALQQLFSAAGLQPGLTQQAMQTGMGVSGLQGQNQQQALQNAFAAQQQMMSQAQPFLNILYPQAGTQQAQVNPFSFESAVPDANTLYNAYFQASQPQQIAQQGQDNTGAYTGLAGSDHNPVYSPASRHLNLPDK